MPCPRCQHDRVDPHPDSTATIGWFRCPACDQEWSARFHGDFLIGIVLMGGKARGLATATK